MNLETRTAYILIELFEETCVTVLHPDSKLYETPACALNWYLIISKRQCVSGQPATVISNHIRVHNYGVKQY